jgi:hypothetical protein
MLQLKNTASLRPAPTTTLARAGRVQTFIFVYKRLNIDKAEFWHEGLSY